MFGFRGAQPAYVDRGAIARTVPLPRCSYITTGELFRHNINAFADEHGPVGRLMREVVNRLMSGELRRVVTTLEGLVAAVVDSATGGDP